MERSPSLGRAARRRASGQPPVAIIGAGIGGLTLALELADAGTPFRIFEAAPQIGATGVGINVLPHASTELARLGLEPALVAVAVQTDRAAFFNRFGQLIYEEPLGRPAGYAHPQLSIHRGDLQAVLVDALERREITVEVGWRCTGFVQDSRGVTLHFETGSTRESRSVRAAAAIGCDGIHSVLRRQLNPMEGAPRYSGVNMWRGVSRWPPIYGGATMIRAGWLATGKLVVYPIRSGIDALGNQLVNWVAEIETDRYRERDWNREGRLEDFVTSFESWQFDWLDVPAFLSASEIVLEYPMVDQEPLEQWSFGRVTLLGDAAHPMVPRGSNGAGQAILDARALCDAFVADAGDPVAALTAYEGRRREATAAVVRANRVAPPDTILKIVYERTGDRPFVNRDDVATTDELRAVTDRYKAIAGNAIDARATTN